MDPKKGFSICYKARYSGFNSCPSKKSTLQAKSNFFYRGWGWASILLRLMQSTYVWNLRTLSAEFRETGFPKGGRVRSEKFKSEHLQADCCLAQLCHCGLCQLHLRGKAVNEMAKLHDYNCEDVYAKCWQKCSKKGHTNHFIKEF